MSRTSFCPGTRQGSPDWNEVGAWATGAVSAMVESVYEIGDVTGNYQSTVLVWGRSTVNISGKSTVTGVVLPVGDIAFSLPEYGYTDRAEEVKLLARNDLYGSVVWTLTKGETAFPC